FPVLDVTVWALAPVAVLVAATTAFGTTAPVLSVTRPVIVPRVVCAGKGRRQRMNANRVVAKRRIDMVILHDAPIISKQVEAYCDVSMSRPPGVDLTMMRTKFGNAVFLLIISTQIFVAAE